MKEDKVLSDIFRRISTIDYIKPEAIPEMELYMEQLTGFLSSHLEKAGRGEDSSLTKTMINNYVKSGLIPPPEKKKYSPDQLILLIFIYYYKNLMPMEDIGILLSELTGRYVKERKAPEENGEKAKEKPPESGRSLSDIYETVYRLCQRQGRKTASDILQKYKAASEAVSGEDAAEEEYLKLFAFLGAMSFDIALKKAAMETVIEHLSGLTPDPSSSSPDGKR